MPLDKYKGEQVIAFKCKRCDGKGIYFNWNNSELAPYQSIGFSEKLAAAARRDYDRARHECEVCKGKGVIYEPTGSQP